jgi:hypothetical protein
MAWIKLCLSKKGSDTQHCCILHSRSHIFNNFWKKILIFSLLLKLNSEPQDTSRRINRFINFPSLHSYLFSSFIYFLPLYIYLFMYSLISFVFISSFLIYSSLFTVLPIYVYICFLAKLHILKYTPHLVHRRLNNTSNVTKSH